MASKPGILTDWPWKNLGSFKDLIDAFNYSPVPKFSVVFDERERDLANFLILPFLLWRMIHNQIWISLSRYQTAKGHNRIVDKGIEFEQVDRERNWDDQILLNGVFFYLGTMVLPGARHLPMWRADGIIVTILLHMGPVEFLYYWFHRALHHHYLYSRYHSHHHSSIVPEPITSVIHPFAELVAYFVLFAIPMLTTVVTWNGEELNRNGELYIQRCPKLKIKVVDGSSLAVAVVLNSIPKGTTQVLLRGKLSKVACSIAFALCQRGIQVATLHEHEYEKLKIRLHANSGSNLVLSKSYAQKIWLVGDGLSEEEQLKASKGTLFIPISQLPPKKMRKDCFYHNTPAMMTPLSLENVHSCEVIGCELCDEGVARPCCDGGRWNDKHGRSGSDDGTCAWL
ncbi:hypothetical protein L1049_018309 [Liquidambar formosana]|uniref:Uncharacterized protein n=1 Tax=Liquidambar formosana TaxID=63359 RepID=A0AAP0R9W1_LIQFO